MYVVSSKELKRTQLDQASCHFGKFSGCAQFEHLQAAYYRGVCLVVLKMNVTGLYLEIVHGFLCCLL